MREKLSAREQKLKRIEGVIRSRKGNVIHVDLVYSSMHKAIDTWYRENYERDDPHGYTRNGHLFLLERFYNPHNFKNHETLEKERDKLLVELDTQIQMRRLD